jgi:type V secretory pathway adhesin AidA
LRSRRADSNVTNLTNNDSLIRFSGPAGDPTQLSSYKTLTAVNYTGTGGEILLNTYLGGDGSPSDRLIINGGTATGSTGLFIHNTTGQGAETTGNGILVVNALKWRHNNSGRLHAHRRSAGQRFQLRFVSRRAWRQRSQ